jgi:hypothetical protein
MAVAALTKTCSPWIHTPWATVAVTTQSKSARRKAGRVRVEVWLPADVAARLEDLARDAGSASDAVAAAIDAVWTSHAQYARADAWFGRCTTPSCALPRGHQGNHVT